MADKDRAITGTVDVAQVETVAMTAKEMAYELWIAEFRAQPKASDENFLELVSNCARALRGNAPIGAFSGVIKAMFPKQK